MAEIQAESPNLLRRRGIAEIATAIEGLQARQDRVRDFHVFTAPVVWTIRRLIEQLGATQQEHAACEVLRQVRDSFYDGGWHGYRDEKTRRGVIAIMERHLGGDEVKPSAIATAFEEMVDLGLRPVPVIPGLFSLVAAEEANDDAHKPVAD